MESEAKYSKMEQIKDNKTDQPEDLVTIKTDEITPDSLMIKKSDLHGIEELENIKDDTKNEPK